MTDVYNRTVFEENSIQTVPNEYAENTANNLFKFLGSFWRDIHGDTGFIKGVQRVRGVKMAQFYLDLLETLKLQDRKGMPVFHRELWKPIVIRKSKADTAQENVLRMSDGVVLGEQPDGSKYGNGTKLQLGKLASFDNFVTYPVEDEIQTIVSGLANNVVNPTVTYKVSTEFPSADVTYVNGTLIFPKDKDPFAPGSGFDAYDVELDENGNPDQEIVLWASDVLIDKNFISTHMAYALRIDCKSSAIVKRILNAGWDILNCGMTPELYRAILAAMLNIPVVQNASERVIDIIESDKGTTVVTDSHKYTLYKDAKLRKCVRLGSVLKRGDLLDQSVKIYPVLTDVAKLDNITEYAETFGEDVPVMTVPCSLISTRTAFGLGVRWHDVEVMDSGETWGTKDGEHRKLFFEMSGRQEDIDAFWEEVWSRAEETGVDMDDLFNSCVGDGTVQKIDGDDGSDDRWMINPMAFFLKYMLGANTLIVTVDTAQVEDKSLLRDSMFFSLLNDAVPSGMRMFFIEHTDIGDDEVDLGDSDDVEDDTDEFVLKEASDDEFDYLDLPGIKGKHVPTYEEQIEMKFFRNRKRNAV